MAHCLSVYLSAYLWAQRPYPPSIYTSPNLTYPRVHTCHAHGSGSPADLWSEVV